MNIINPVGLSNVPQRPSGDMWVGSGVRLRLPLGVLVGSGGFCCRTLSRAAVVVSFGVVITENSLRYATAVCNNYLKIFESGLLPFVCSGLAG
jgi:hypothetical protein